MKRIIIVLLSALAVFCCTLLFVDEYITETNITTAQKHNARLLRDVSRKMNVELVLAARSAESFMSGIFYCKNDTLNDSPKPEFYIRDTEIRTFTRYIDEELRGLLNGNPKIMRALVLVDDSVSKANRRYGFTENYTRCLAQDDSVATNIGDYDFMHSASYNKVKAERKSLWVLPSTVSQMNKKIIIYYVPILCENGSFFGTFAINLDISSVRHELEDHLPYGKEDSEIFIRDQRGRIVVSYPEIYEKYDSVSTLVDEIVKDKYVSKIDTSGSNVYTYYKGERWLLQTSPISAANWTVYSINKESAIYKTVNHIRWIVFSVSILGMLLMLLCCYVIFRQVGKDLRKKALAENEIQMAAKVQSDILCAPSFTNQDVQVDAFLRPAHDAGGDLYSYLERDGKLVFCLGDVSDKGMPAALFMTQVHSLFLDAVRHSLSPDQIMSEINDVLAENNPSMTFCTLIVGVVDGNELTFCNGGHNRPVLLRKDAKPEFLVMRPNLAVGLMEGFPFSNETLQLNSGDTLLLYTDGVTEAKNKQHKEFGNDRLLEVLTGKEQDFINVTLSAVEEFVGNNEQSDDITLLSLRSR